MSNSLWSTLKNIGINLVPIRPPNPLLHPFVHDYPIKNVSSFTSRLSKENKRKEEIYLSRTVLLLTVTFSLGIVAWLNSYACLLRSLRSFLFLLNGYVFNAIFRFYFVHCHPWSNMHAFMFLFYFFFNERLVIHSAIHSFVVHLLYHLSTFLRPFLSNLNAGHV